MMTINFKSKAKFGNKAILVAKFNHFFLEIKGRRGCKNKNWSDYKLREMSFHNYGNPLRVSNYFPIGSTKDIIN